MRAWGSNVSKKKTNFTRVIYLNWLAKIELKGPGSPSCQIVVNYCFKIALITIEFIVDFLKTLVALKKPILKKNKK